MFVVTLPLSAEKNPRAFALKAKHAGADVLEIRGDLTPNVAKFSSPLPLIVSPRGTGSKLIERFAPKFVDLEIQELEHCDHENCHSEPCRTMTKRNHAKLILSFHDYHRTPSLVELKKKVQKMCTKKPWAVKIATMVQSYDDLLILDKLQNYLKSRKIRSVVLGMGTRAHVNRMLSPVKNALTYACLDQNSSAAPGQLPLHLYALMSHVKKPKIFGIIGGPQVLHSLSPLIHGTLFRRHHYDALYSVFPITQGERLAAVFPILEKLRVNGLSVTAPCKIDILRHTDEQDDLVKILQSSNTLILRKGKWMATNTDSEGFERGFPFLRNAESVAVTGSGGVVPAVLDALRRMCVRSIHLYARNAEARRALGERFGVETHTLEELRSAKFDAVIQTIPEDRILPLPTSSHGKSFVDLRVTTAVKSLEKAKRLGYATYNGLPMLIEQALAQFQLFTGIAATKQDKMALSKVLSPFSHG